MASTTQLHRVGKAALDVPPARLQEPFARAVARPKKSYLPQWPFISENSWKSPLGPLKDGTELWEAKSSHL